MKQLMVIFFSLGLLVGCETNGEISDANTTDPTDPIDTDLVPNWEWFPEEFEVVLMRANATDPFVAGNSLDAFEAAYEQGLKFVEVDFVMSQDGELIAAHHDQLGGNCGNASDSTLDELRDCRLSGDRRIGTLEDLLEFEFSSIYIDLKASSGTTSEELYDVVEHNVEAIEEADAADRAVVMLYDIDEASAQLLAEREIRGGIKGYPSDPESVMAMIEEAEEHGLEMMCINASNLTPEQVHESARRGVWQLPWDHAEESNIPHWEDLIEAGIGGMIVDTDDIIPDDSIAKWQDVRHHVDVESDEDN